MSDSWNCETLIMQDFSNIDFNEMHNINNNDLALVT